MSGTDPDYDAPVVIIPDPDQVEVYVWVIDYGKGMSGVLTTVSVAGEHPVTAARRYDPRKNKGNEDLRAALVKVTVPKSELRRLS